MIKYIGAAVAAIAIAYEMTTLAYGALMVGVAVPAEQRCESSALYAAEQAFKSPQNGADAFANVEQICKHSAAVAGALVPSGLKP
ncbi:hypothetical protein AB4Y36_19480 [Paraburkholderia sp. BR10936]|uniref:hypothetical protein n=1 Tax=Paraburkholderia sp. BR10936 TaxID=3236993 RepID=UPI0034D1AB7A